MSAQPQPLGELGAATSDGSRQVWAVDPAWRAALLQQIADLRKSLQRGRLRKELLELERRTQVGRR